MKVQSGVATTLLVVIIFASFFFLQSVDAIRGLHQFDPRLIPAPQHNNNAPEADSLGTKDVPRPILPKHIFVDQGEVACLGGSGVPCSGVTQGSIHAWYQFGDDNRVEQYREDSILFDPTLGATQPSAYNREYSNLTQATYFFLSSDTASTLQCTSTPFGFFNFTRDFLTTATYIGITQPSGPLSVGKKAHTFVSTWQLAGQPLAVTAWVLVDQPDKLWGFTFLTIRYGMYHYFDMDSTGFHPSPFAKPQGVTGC